MKKFIYTLCAFFLLCVTTSSSCGDDEGIEMDGPNGYRLIEDRLYLSHTENTIYFTIDNQTLPVFERYVIDNKGEKKKVYYVNFKGDEPDRQYEISKINSGAFRVKFYTSTPLEGDTTSIDILEFKSGRIDTIKTVYTITEAENSAMLGGSGVVLKKAWYNSNLFYDDYQETDSIVVKN